MKSSPKNKLKCCTYCRELFLWCYWWTLLQKQEDAILGTTKIPLSSYPCLLVQPAPGSHTSCTSWNHWQALVSVEVRQKIMHISRTVDALVNTPHPFTSLKSLLLHPKILRCDCIAVGSYWNCSQPIAHISSHFTFCYWLWLANKCQKASKF